MNYNLRSKSKITPIDQPNEVVLKKAGRRGRPKKVNTATEVNEQLSESNETAAAINERINNVENELNEKEEDDFIRLENEEERSVGIEENKSIEDLLNEGEYEREFNSTRIGDILSVMSEFELDETIIAEDEFYESIMNDEDFDDKTFNKNDDDEDSNIDDNQFYDEDNLHSMLNNLNLNVELNADLKFVQTKRKARKLLHEGYTYVRDRGEFECIQWKCSYVLSVTAYENGKRKYIYCPGRVHTYNDRDLKIVTEHKLHLPAK